MRDQGEKEFVQRRGRRCTILPEFGNQNGNAGFQQGGRMERRTSVTVVLAAMLALAMGAAAMAADSNVGTWKLNLAKSTFSPGPAPKSQTLMIEAWGEDGVKYAADGMDADGKPMHWEVQAKYDGKLYPFKGNPDADMLSYKRIDASTVESTTQLKGKPMLTTRIVVSKDGKTRTLTQTGKNAKGQDVKNLLVYDKQ
jgi:hypothetical protein